MALVNTERTERDKRQRDSDITARDVENLKEWIAKQPHLPQDHDDSWLETFLRERDYSLERCKETLDSYYTVRNTMPDIFLKRDPSSSEQRDAALKYAGFMLPGYDLNGRTVVFVKLLDTDLKAFDLLTIARRVTMCADYFLREYSNELVFILDAKGISMAHFLKIPIPLAKDCLTLVQEVYPVRIKEVFIINPPGIIELGLKMFYPFMNDKLKDTIHIVEKIEDIYVSLSQDMLPNEFGGKAGTINELNDQWQTTLENGRDWFLEEADKKTDETKRLGKSTHFGKSDNVFGSGGSFRTLNFD